MKRENKEVDFLVCYQGTLGATLLGTLLTCKEIKTLKIPGQGVLRVGKGTIRADQDF